MKRYTTSYFFTILLNFSLPSFTQSQSITEIIDINGDGAGNNLLLCYGIATDGSDNVYVTGLDSDNAFKITPGGTITEIIDNTGDGAGNSLDGPYIIATDGSGNVYVTGFYTDNAFKITPGGTITEIIDNTGDGAGNSLDGSFEIATDGSGNVYVTGFHTDNVFKITPGGTITEIIDNTGDGAGNSLDESFGIATDGSGNVYVTGRDSDNAFKITPGGTITEIIDITGDGAGSGNFFYSPHRIATDGSGNVYVAGSNADNAYKIGTFQLPVELIDFYGRVINEKIQLKWTTAIELNNLGFEIQKSKEGIDWEVIDFVEGLGTTNDVNEYQYQDKNPYKGINHYRLKQIDFDGTFEYSNVIAVEYENPEMNFNVFPNPSNGLINLQIDNPSNQEIKIKVLDNIGRRITESEIIQGESNLQKEMEIKRSGIYIITVQIRDEVFYEKIVINN